MKIAFLVKNFPPIPDGVGDYLFWFVHHLSKIEDVQKIYVLTSVTLTSPPILDQKIEVFPIVEKWNRNGFKAIALMMQKLNPDHVTLQYVPYMYDYYGLPFFLLRSWWYLKNKGLRSSIFFHEIGTVFNKGMKYWPVAILQRIIVNVLGKMNDISFTSMQLYSDMLWAVRKKVVLPIPSNIIIEVRDCDKIRKLKEELSENDKYFLISTFGSDAPERGFQFVLEAVKDIPGVRVIHIGSGERMKAMSQELGLDNQIKVTGYLPVEEAYYHLAATDLFCLPHSDIRGGIGFKSGSLAAAMYCELPVLSCRGNATDISLLIHRENVFLLPEKAGKPEFKVAIMELMNDRPLLTRLASGGKSLYNRHLNWEIVTERYYSHIKAL